MKRRTVQLLKSSASWQTATADDYHVVGVSLAHQLGEPFRFKELREHAFRGINRTAVILDHLGSEFSVVPGGKTSLGFDPERIPNNAQGQPTSWQQMAEGENILPYLTRVLLPLTDFEAAPLLVEVRSWNPSLEPIGATFPQIERPLANLAIDELGLPQTLTQSGQRHQVEPLCHGDVVSRFAEAGFRLLNSLEWEYCCRSGAETVFKWGDYWVKSFPDETKAWQTHLQPNGFGLIIASRPHNWEYVKEHNLLRGGDGGNCLCGGADHLDAWLTLAPSFGATPPGNLLNESFFTIHARRCVDLARHIYF